MSPVTLHLPVRHAAWFGQHDLWQRTLDMAFLPDVDESINLVPDADDLMLWPVVRRYWDPTGAVVLELAAMQVNPDPAALRECGRLRRPITLADPEDAARMLADSGWTQL